MGKNEILVEAIQEIRTDTEQNRNEDVRKVNQLIDQADVNCQIEGMRPVHWSADGGHLDVLKGLKTNGADLDAKAANGKSCIHFAARSGNVKMVIFLKHQVHTIDKQNQTALHIASIMGNQPVVEVLIELMGADTSVTNLLGETPEMCSDPSLKKYWDDLAILRAKADRERKEEEDRLEWERNAVKRQMEQEAKEMEEMKLALQKQFQDEKEAEEARRAAEAHWQELLIEAEKLRREDEERMSRETADVDSQKLIEASKQGCIIDVRELLLNPFIQVNKHDVNGDTALMQACEFGHLDIVKVLLDHDSCDVNHRNSNGYVPIIIAGRNGQTAIVQYLLTKGADINRENINGDTALTWASNNQHPETVALLLSQGGEVNHCTKSGATALTLAGAGRSSEVTRLLLAQGANINHQNNNGESALILAAAWGKTENARLLLANSECNTTLKDREGESAESEARRKGFNDISYLIQARDYGWNPLTWIANKGATESTRMLLQQGEDINRQDKYGWTPLIRAARFGHKEVVEILLLHPKLDVNVQTTHDFVDIPQGRTAEDAARIRCHLEIAEMIKRFAEQHTMKRIRSC